ncbi:MAG TPA: hypothetical protein PKE26_15465 [Kiritimatiellia bacterium]|nr:hypothetical protein [Saprospiraceae bacterium]HMP00493.1 hypothetical protein [Kiritimatiellia bacterium]
MVQKLNRLIGRADFRVLVCFAILTVLVTIGWATAQLADDSNTVDTLQDVAELFLELRENSYQLAVPSWYMYGDVLESIEENYGLAGFAQQPDWFVAFSGELFFSPKSEIAQQIEHGTKLVIYEDILTSELLIVREDSGKEEIVFKSPDWPEVGVNEPYKNYLYRELSKRRISWHVVLKDINQAEEEYAAMLAAMEEDEGEGGSMMMLMGGGDELAIAGMEILTNGLLLNLEYTASFSGTVWSAYSYDAPVCHEDDIDCATSPSDSFNGLDQVWTMVSDEVLLTGETFTAWIDTRPLAQDLAGNTVNRFYAFGNNEIDTDSDGLNNAFELFVSKGNPELSDTDGDGFTDAHEWNYFTNPNNPHDPPNIKGSVSYVGQQTNIIRVLAVTDSNSWSIAYATSIATTGNYHLVHIPPATYFIKAFRDVNGNGLLDSEDAIGVYSNNPVIVTGQIQGVNLTLTEQDTDGDKISNYAERTIFRTDPNNASDIPLQLTRASVECYYGHASGSTNWQLKEGVSGLIKSFNIGRGWVTNGMFLPDLTVASETIYFGEAIGTTTNNKGGWIYASVNTLDSDVDMGKGWVWNKGFLTDFREASRQVSYFRPKPSAYPDLFVYSHSTDANRDYLGFGWARPGSFVTDLSSAYNDIYQGLVYAHFNSTNMTRTHTLPASRTSTHKKGRLGLGWASAAGYIPDTTTVRYYYYGRLKDSRGYSGYSTSSLDFDFGTYMTLGYGYLAGGDFIPNPATAGGPPIESYDQDGDGFIDIPMASDTQFATLDDGDFLQLPVTIGDASGSHTEMYGFDIGSFKYDMPFVNGTEYLFTSIVPLERGQTYSGALRSLPDSDTDGDYTFLLGGYIEGPSTNLVYVSAEQLGVVVVANFPHSGSQNTNIFGYVNDSGFNSGSKSFTLHVPRINIRAHRPGPLNSPGVEVTRFHEHQPFAVILPARNQSAPATLTTNDGYVSKLAVDRFLPTGITNGFIRVTISNTNVLALYDHNNNKMPNNLLYNVATISATNPLYQLKSAARTWHALGLTNGTASVTLSYGLTTNSVLCSDTIQFGVISIEFTEMWETMNKANRIFNPTRKDDPVNDEDPDSNGDTYGVPRNHLYMVPDPFDGTYKVTVIANIQPAALRERFYVAGCISNEIISGSGRVPFDTSGKCEFNFLHYGYFPDIADFTIKAGFDNNGNNQLDNNEFIPIFVKNTTTNQIVGEPIIKGTSESRYNTAKRKIDDIVSGWYYLPGDTAYILPHARQLLRIFRDGNISGVPLSKQPSAFSNLTFNAFGGYFSEWLTHNSGAQFDDTGNAVMTEYTWDRFTSLANLVASTPQIDGVLVSFYEQSIYPFVTNYFASLPSGTTNYFPSEPENGFDVTRISESPYWVPSNTVSLSAAFEVPSNADDVLGSVGRGRLVSHKVRFKVEKVETGSGPEVFVTEVQSWGEVIDLYDFNHDAGGAPQDAAILQVGYGKGSYGTSRNRGKIFRDRIEFNKLYTELP